MKIEIDLPDQIVREAALLAWKREFLQPQYSSEKGGSGYERVRECVIQHIQTLDPKDAVQRTVEIILPTVLRDVVSSELQKVVKAEIRRQKTEGCFGKKSEAELKGMA